METKSESSRKRQNLSYEKPKDNMPSPTDRFSDLTDDLVVHILSFLPTRISIKTSILARRWRFLWAHVPSLDFGTRDGCTELTYSEIINRIMLLHKAPTMNAFRLRFDDFECSDYELETWTTIAILRNVRILDICLHYSSTLPRHLFTCKTLVELTVTYCTLPRSSGAVYLPGLKKLHLSCVEYETVETLPHLLSGCPVLEELIINGGDDDDEDDGICFWNICAPTFLRLFLKISPYHDECKVEIISAPALKYIRLHHCWYEHLKLCPLTSLIEADIFLNKLEVEEQYYYNKLSVLDLLHSIRYVKCLKLSGANKKFLDITIEESSRPIISFCNLRKLVLGADWRFLARFLEGADNLEVLIVSEIERDLKIWIEPIQQQPASLSSLRNIRIDSFGRSQEEFDMVRYFLRNAKSLKTMEIYFKRDELNLEENFDTLQRISSLPRGCMDCQLTFN